MTNSGTGNRQQGTKNYSMTAWLGTRVCFIDLTWSKRPGRRPLQFSKPGTIIRPLISQIMLRASGDRKQPCALSNAISIIGFLRQAVAEYEGGSPLIRYKLAYTQADYRGCSHALPCCCAAPRPRKRCSSHHKAGTQIPLQTSFDIAPIDVRKADPCASGARPVPDRVGPR